MSRAKLIPALLGAVLLLGAAAGGGYLVGERQKSEKVETAPVVSGSLSKVSECGVEKPVARPQEITMTCADGGVVLHNIDWRSWEPDLAVAVGSTTENTCEPSCANGIFIEHSVNVVLFDAVSNGAGPQFTKATVTYQDEERTYDGNQSITYDLAPYESR